MKLLLLITNFVSLTFFVILTDAKKDPARFADIQK